jgi:hypothetical protein
MKGGGRYGGKRGRPGVERRRRAGVERGGRETYYIHVYIERGERERETYHHFELTLASIRTCHEPNSIS